MLPISQEGLGPSKAGSPGWKDTAYFPGLRDAFSFFMLGASRKNILPEKKRPAWKASLPHCPDLPDHLHFLAHPHGSLTSAAMVSYLPPFSPLPLWAGDALVNSVHLFFIGFFHSRFPGKEPGASFGVRQIRDSNPVKSISCRQGLGELFNCSVPYI